MNDLIEPKQQKTSKDNDANLLQSIKQADQTFIHLIRQRLGIIIHQHQLTELHKTILTGCKKFNCAPDVYLEHLKQCQDKSPYLEHLIAGITVGETYFFRDKSQMKLLEEKILPAIFARKRQMQELSIRVWSAGCASGEEIYTIAIMLKEMLKDFDKWTISLLGTDINTFSLQRAMEGAYSEWSMRSITDYHKKKYFTIHGQRYHLQNSIREMVNFDYLNLNDDTYPSIFNGTNAQDLILCRNVLIYFDMQRISQLMQRLSMSLVPHGALILGASDPFDAKNPHLTFHYKSGMLFTRIDETAAITIETPAPAPIAKPIATKPAITKPLTLKPRATPPKTVAPIIKATYSIEHIHKLIDEKKWHELLNLQVTFRYKEDNAFVLAAKATALANIGHIESAKRLFEDSIAMDSTNKYTYFNYALTLGELNQHQLAEATLRKTLFLDHQFVAAHYQLGLLLLRSKKHSEGIKSLKNAMRIASLQDPAASVPGSQGLNYGRLTDILTHEIELYTTGLPA